MMLLVLITISTTIKKGSHTSKIKTTNPERNIKYKTLTTILKSIDTFVNIATISSSITLSLTGIGLTAVSISTATASGISSGKKVVYEVYEIIINNYKKYRKQDEKDQQTIKSFEKLYRKRLQDDLIDENENESLCNLFTKNLDETKNQSSL